MTQKTRRQLQSALIGGLFIISFIALFQAFSTMERFEDATLDWRYRHFNRTTAMSDQVQIFDVDEITLKVLEPIYGRWPWPRRAHKEFIEFAATGQPEGVFFDIEFSESQKGTDDDSQLAQASANAQVVSHAMAFMEPGAPGTKQENLPADFARRFAVSNERSVTGLAGFPQFIHFTEYRVPNATLYSQIPRIHAVNTDPDADGVFRHVPLLVRYGDQWMPTLSLAAVLTTYKDPVLLYRDGALIITAEGTPPGGLRVPVDSHGRLRLHFYSSEKTTPMTRIASALDAQIKITRGEVTDPAQLPVNPLSLENKLLLVGASATGLADLKVTPVASSYPGVLLHATAISNMLKGDFLRTLPSSASLVITALAVFAFYYFGLFLSHIALKLVLPMLLLATYWAFGIWAFQQQSLHIPLAAPTLGGLAAILHGFAYMSFIEARDRKKMQGALSKYLSPSVAAHLVANGINPQAEVGRDQELSVLFSDIRGFTTLSERFRAPIVVEVLNKYLGRMTNVIFEKDGTLDKFIGDAIMAFWGAPLEDQAHAVKSVACAFEMRKQLAILKRELAESDADAGLKDVQLNIGIGINTGRVIVGNIGSEKRLDYTVIGDNVNLASRIEGLTKQYHVDFLVGERTREMIKERFICRELDWVKAKGKNKPVSIFEPLCEKSAPDAHEYEALAAEFQTGLDHYRKGMFQEAKTQFESILARRPKDGPSQTFVERCGELLADSPDNWDGVFVAKSK
ncbi:MAG: hypothetical protein A2428_00720 [Bdellovibrionales bacterium RIFOXYC1_FULL_54_43]|nr:MAG: hypothetical protein A2428_00720 [Bdellovibrionales bacterium RIFOXYC1_FULL_54_43]OFZ82109.1 MAG: hypothetical protein A2603_11420 [Bdellovibrionales bacterium RIFOXYD1_FULL_55_31]